MPGVPAKIAKHSLDVRKDAMPIKQALHHFAIEKQRAIGVEIS